MIKSYIEKTSLGDLEITPVFHGSVYLKFQGKDIHIDPWSKGDYSEFSKADVIIITHPHGDHLDSELVRKLNNPKTRIIVNKTSHDQLKDLNPIVLSNGDKITVDGIQIEAIPAYNIVRERSPGVKFHPKGEGNGYVITFGDTRVFIAGDTEAIPEIENLKDINIAFLPIRLPYTMSAEEAAEVTIKFKPKVVYPYHTGGEPVPEIFTTILKDEKIEIKGPYL